MRTLPLTLAVVLGLAFVTTGCGPTRPPCNASTCSGCCDATGMCQFGSSLQACGSRGEACKQCSITETCSFGSCTTGLGGTGGGSGGSGGGGSAGGGAAGGNAGGFAGGSAGGVAGGSAGGVAGGSAGGFAGGSAGGFAGGSAGGFAGGSAGGFAGGSAGGFAGGAAGGVAGGSGGGGAGAPGDFCLAPIVMTPISPTQFTATATLTGATDEKAASCGGAGPEVFLSFAVSTVSDVSFTITPIGGSATPVGYIVRDTCADEFGCSTGSSASTPVRLQPGSYRLVVDSLSSGVSGSFTATVTLSTPAPRVGDSCSNAEVLTLTGGTASVSATTAGYADDHSSLSCSTAGPDRYYRFTLSSTSNLSAVLTPSLTGFGALYLLGPSSTCSSAFETTCRAGTSPGATTTLTASALAAGTYYLVVKNVSTGDGSFSLSVSASTVSVPGDSCSSAIPLSFFSGTATATGTTVGATNDRSVTCATGGADVVYSFTATTGQVFSATVTPTSPASSWRPVLSLNAAGACSTASEAACNAATFTGGTATVTSAPLAAGTYFLWVDSTSGFGTGTFSLSASLTASSGSGESCTGPALLTFSGGSASTSGSLTNRFNDASTSLCITTGFSGPDAVYSFTVTSTQTFSATLFPSGFRGSLSLRGPTTTCSIASELDCISASTTSASVSLPSIQLSPGTYYLWVDSPSGSSGSFTLSATLSGGSTSIGESCTGPIPLTFSLGSSGTASVSGSTSTAINDAQQGCGGSGPDRVYSFTVSSTRTFSASANGFTDIVLALRGPSSTCSASSELACNTSGTSFANISSQTLSPGTYYLWVDGFGGASGSFTLTANLN
ncbi:MAG: hypothetical protein MUC96_07795 [Myxococcaceae bacterium]|nr:hypothetical protein [Myxococcaceae bacterium]